MIRLILEDNAEMAIEGEDAASIINQMRESLSQSNELVRMRSEIARIARDVTFLVRQYDGDANVHPEACTLKGTRRRQFEWVCAYMKERPKSSVLEPCRIAVAEVTGPDGYSSARSLQRYCCAHRHSFVG